MNLQPHWHSAIYQGHIRHRRMSPRPHEFSYRMFMMYLDLAEIKEVFSSSRWFSDGGFGCAQFRREDHLGDTAVPLDQSVRDLVEQQTGHRPAGAIRLLTHLRYFGHVFNPVSFYYCFDAGDTSLQCIVVEVNNTPWGEQHCYILDSHEDQGEGRLHRWQQPKAMHVSPFMPMDMHYDWRMMRPGKQLNVHMQNSQAGSKVFDATLTLQRKEISPATLRGVLFRFPLMTLKVVLAIHWQALRLWLKRVPVFDHPAKRATDKQQTQNEGSLP